MLKKFIIILITTFALTLNVSASSDGELLLEKIIQLKLKSVGKDLTKLLLLLIKD